MKIELLKRELFDAEASLKKMSELDGKVRLAYAIAKNSRIISNKISELKFAIKMKQDKYQRAIVYEENKSIIINDSTLSKDKKIESLHDLDEKYPGIKFALDDHKRETEEILSESIALDLYEIKAEWLPTSFKIGALGPLVEVVTGIDDIK